MDVLSFIGDAIGFVIGMLFNIGGFLTDKLNAFLAWFSVGQLKLLILGIGVLLGFIAWFMSRRKLIGVTVGVVMYAFGHFMVAVHIMTRPTDDRWRSPDSATREQPDLPDAPLIGGALDQLEGVIGEIYNGLDNVANFSDAVMLASGFAFRGTLWLMLLVPLGFLLMHQAVKARRELKTQQLKQKELNEALADQVIELQESVNWLIQNAEATQQNRY